MGRHHVQAPSARQETPDLVVSVPEDVSEPASIGPAPSPEPSSSTASPGLASTQPVALTSAVQAVLAAAVAAGWVALDSTAVAAVASGVAGLIWLLLTLFTRSKVTPTARPRDEQGRPLTPDSKEAA